MAIAAQASGPDLNKYNKRSLFVFTLKNPLRLFFIRILEDKRTDQTVLLLILLNTCQLALYNPLVGGNAMLAPVAKGHWAQEMEATFEVTGA